MSTYQIAVVVGSLRKDSMNRKLAEGLVKLVPPEFSFTFLDVGLLPLYNQDDDDKQGPTVKEFKKKISESQGVLFVTPEYNRSVSGVLKNAIDHGSRPYGNNSWAGKPAAVIGASPGTIGTAAAQQHLRNILVCINMPTLNQPEAFVHVSESFFNADGTLSEDRKPFLQKWMTAFTSFVKKHSA